MNNNQSKNNPIQEQIKLLQQCPICKGQYDAKQAKVVEERGEANLIHITCPHCSNSILAVVVISQIGMSSVGMMTDLGENDVKRLRNKNSISEDELLDFHSLLQSNQLNFSK
ncbi:MAG TPA: hypothetical protein DEB09_02950 [Candidatus Magasanikbacteria bacterium]|nr:hypothetical protein [Candidatus Magasanikbacteria bacterium]